MAITKVTTGTIEAGTIVNADVNAAAAIVSTKLSGVESGLTSVQTFTSSGTWTRPSGITKVLMEVQGAGGSGSGSVNGENAQGGGGGGYAKKFLNVSSISTATITVGTGGAGVVGSSGTNAGIIGGASSWADGTNTITGNGGAAGQTTADTPTVGGTATNGDINIQGGYGNSRFSGTGPFFGGSSMLGFGDMGKATGRTTVAQNPVGYGAGSGGAFNTGSSQAGGAGIVIVWEYK